MQWFYEEKGKIVGPVSRSDIVRLIIQRHLHSESLVWTEAFGTEWRPVSRSGLIAPLPAEGIKEKKLPFLSIHIARIGTEARLEKKKYKKISEISSLWAWIYLIVPDGLTFLFQIAAYMRGQGMIESLPLSAFLAINIILIVSFVCDRKELHSAGVKPPVFISFLIPSLYLWLRALRLGRGRILFFASILMIMARLLIFTYDLPGQYRFLSWGQFVSHSVASHQEEQKSVPQETQEETEKGPLNF